MEGETGIATPSPPVEGRFSTKRSSPSCFTSRGARKRCFFLIGQKKHRNWRPSRLWPLAISSAEGTFRAIFWRFPLPWINGQTHPTCPGVMSGCQRGVSASPLPFTEHKSSTCCLACSLIAANEYRPYPHIHNQGGLQVAYASKRTRLRTPPWPMGN